MKGYGNMCFAITSFMVTIVFFTSTHYLYAVNEYQAKTERGVDERKHFFKSTHAIASFSYAMLLIHYYADGVRVKSNFTNFWQQN